MAGRNGKIRRAPGFEDCVGSEFERIDAAIRNAREVLYARGYQPLETPLIEQTELFLRRSGGLLSSQLFGFTAPDGSEISLRPELTAPVIRHALERNQGPLPWRYQYASPIFRYTERQYDAPPSSVPSRRQFIQVGAELIGESHPAADGEIIAAAYAMAQQLGIKKVAIRIGHVGLIWEVLRQFNLSERARSFLANRVSEFRNGDDGGAAVEAEAIRLGLMSRAEQEGVETQASAADLLSRLASGSIEFPRGSEIAGRRSEDVVEGLRRKLDSDVSNSDFPVAMTLIEEIVSIADDAFPRIEEMLTKRGVAASRGIENLKAVVDAARSGGTDGLDIAVDFGMATSMAYYSGMIFEVSAFIDGAPVQIGGGGRYDGLPASLGSKTDLPALGFALNLDTILDLTRDATSVEPRRRYILLVPFDEAAVDSVLGAASELRAQGHSVVSLFEPQVDAQAMAENLDGAEVATLKIGDAASERYELVFG
jgi:histidyl-tRNA synthetase